MFFSDLVDVLLSEPAPTSALGGGMGRQATDNSEGRIGTSNVICSGNVRTNGLTYKQQKLGVPKKAQGRIREVRTSCSKMAPLNSNRLGDKFDPLILKHGSLTAGEPSLSLSPARLDRVSYARDRRASRRVTSCSAGK